MLSLGVRERVGRAWGARRRGGTGVGCAACAAWEV